MNSCHKALSKGKYAALYFFDLALITFSISSITAVLVTRDRCLWQVRSHNLYSHCGS